MEEDLTYKWAIMMLKEIERHIIEEGCGECRILLSKMCSDAKRKKELK